MSTTADKNDSGEVQFVYVSSASTAFTKADLLDLLAKSRANNTQRNLTGMLLFKDGNFMQALEGKESDIESLYAKIKRDPRHRGCIRLLKQPIRERIFSDWSMGFRDLSDPELQKLPGFNEFLNLPLEADVFEEDESQILKLLLCFKSSMR